MSAETKQILTNCEIIAVDQDPEGAQGHGVWQEGYWRYGQDASRSDQAVSQVAECWTELWMIRQVVNRGFSPLIGMVVLSDWPNCC